MGESGKRKENKDENVATGREYVTAYVEWWQYRLKNWLRHAATETAPRRQMT
jgi:hypothetical protein